MPTFHIKLYLLEFQKKPSRDARTQRNTREDMSIARSVFDCQPARRVPEELHNDSRNLETPSGIQRREGIEKSGSEEPLQSIHLPCFSVGAREKSLDHRNCLKSMTHHAAGIGTCTQSGITIPSYPSSEMHLGKFPDHTEKIARKRRIPRSRCSGSRKSKQPNRWMISSLRNQ